MDDEENTPSRVRMTTCSFCAGDDLIPCHTCGGTGMMEMHIPEINRSAPAFIDVPLPSVHDNNRMVKTFQKAFSNMKNKEWDKIFVVVDIHETILEPNYAGISDEFYPWSMGVLQHLSDRDDICLIMWTCSTKEDREIYDKFFKEHDIVFDHINENPEVADQATWGDFVTKMYANVVLDDKAGFLHDEDWFALHNYFNTYTKY